MANIKQARATITLPVDDAGRSPAVGETFDVDISNAKIVGWLNMGWLVLLNAGPQPDELRPARHRRGAQEDASGADAPS